MKTAERRCEMLKILCQRRGESIKTLAEELGVSERTIQRDVEQLSNTEPIFTQCGRYGGVYVVDGYFSNKMYMNEKELEILHKICAQTDLDKVIITPEERKTLKTIILRYTKPKRGKEDNL